MRTSATWIVATAPQNAEVALQAFRENACGRALAAKVARAHLRTGLRAEGRTSCRGRALAKPAVAAALEKSAARQFWRRRSTASRPFASPPKRGGRRRAKLLAPTPGRRGRLPRCLSEVGAPPRAAAAAGCRRKGRFVWWLCYALLHPWRQQFANARLRHKGLRCIVLPTSPAAHKRLSCKTKNSWSVLGNSCERGHPNPLLATPRKRGTWSGARPLTRKGLSRSRC